MKDSTILKLVFDGDCYADRIKPLDNEEYNKNYEEFNKILEKLCKDLPKEEKDKTLWDIFLAQGGMESAAIDLYFKEGFKLGLIMGAENFFE